MNRPFAFLDRDGTLIASRHYLSTPDEVELLPGVGFALRRLRSLGFGLAVLTNQSGLSRGYFDQSRLDAIHARLRALLAVEGVELDGIYVCPHLPEHDCACRKPRPGLLQQASNDLAFDVRNCIVVGDNACDVDLAHEVGATSILVRTGYGAQVIDQDLARPNYVVEDLVDAMPIFERLITTR